MGLAEDLDKLLTSLGFKKIADLTPDQLNKDVTEKCNETSGTGGCSASVSSDFILQEFQFPLTGAVGIYLDLLWCSDYLPRNGTPQCSIDIEVIGEGDNYQVPLFKRSWDVCVFYA